MLQEFSISEISKISKINLPPTYVVFTGPVLWTSKRPATQHNPTGRDWTSSCSCLNLRMCQLPVATGLLVWWLSRQYPNKSPVIRSTSCNWILLTFSSITQLWNLTWEHSCTLFSDPGIDHHSLEQTWWQWGSLETWRARMAQYIRKTYILLYHAFLCFFMPFHAFSCFSVKAREKYNKSNPPYFSKCLGIWLKK